MRKKEYSTISTAITNLNYQKINYTLSGITNLTTSASYSHKKQLLTYSLWVSLVLDSIDAPEVLTVPSAQVPLCSLPHQLISYRHKL